MLFVLFVNLLIKAVWIFLIDRNVQIRTGYEQYGSYQAFFNLGLIFQILLDFGLTQYSSKKIAAHHTRIRYLFSSMLWLRMILGVVYLVTVFAFAWMLGYRQAQLYLLSGVLVIQLLNSMLVFVRSNIAALQYFKTDGVLAVVDRLLMILVCGSLLVLPQVAGGFRIEWFVWTQIGSYFVALLVAFIVLIRIAPSKIHFYFRPGLFRSVARESMPYALLVLLMSVYMRSDTVMIERLCGAQGKYQAGLYASAFRLLDVCNIFGLMFAGVLLPVFSGMIARKEAVAPLLRLAVNIMMPVAFTASVIASFWNADIMNMLYHKGMHAGDGMLFAVLMWAFPPYCLMYIYSTLLTANGSTRQLNAISAFIVVLNLSLHYLLIRHFLALGAAWTVLITEWLVAACVIIAAHRTFALPHNLRWIATHLLFLGTLAALAAVVRQFIPQSLLAIAVTLVFSVLLLFVFRFWTISSLKALMSRRDA
ncbi:oligosaccharide flippase family protein [Rurimicrobium arvi]|uniref:oligosaccharide flippase family protein n=1 Tax=Rurimicrobium arvi TaxID=2049916 RepID=UPI0031DC99D5